MQYEEGGYKWRMSQEGITTLGGKWALHFKGETKTLREWADEYGLSLFSLYSRLRSGWEIERALTDPKVARRNPPTPIEWRGERLTAAEWAKHLGLPVEIVKGRLQRGWNMERVAKTPYRPQGTKGHL